MGSILSAVYLSPGAMARLCLLALFVLSTFSNNSSANTLRVERDACEEKQEEVQKCQADAYQEYMAAFKAGDDGRPDWMARKSCNYITATIEKCPAIKAYLERNPAAEAEDTQEEVAASVDTAA